MKKSTKLWTIIGTGAAMVFSLSLGLYFSNFEGTTVLAEGSAETTTPDVGETDPSSPDEGEGETKPDEGEGETPVPDVEEKIKIPVPTFTGGLIYNGGLFDLSGNLENFKESIMTLSGDSTAIDAGRYVANLSISDESYVWEDSSFDGQIEWEIQKAELSLSWGQWVYDYTGEPISPKPTAVGVDSGDLICTGDTDKTDVGFYQTEASIKLGSALDQNYYLSDSKKTFDWMIKEKEERAIRVVWGLPENGVFTFNGNVQCPVIEALYGEYDKESIDDYEITFTGDTDSKWVGNYTVRAEIVANDETPLRVVGEEVSYSIQTNGSGEGRLAYLVSFNSNGGSKIVSQSVLLNGKVVKPEDPVRNGYTFVGWFSDAKFETPFNFAYDVITENTTLYAYWYKNETKEEDDLLTLMGCNSSVSASLAVVGGMLVFGVSAIAIKKKSNRK